ncbi:MAG: hypothetical protein HOH43_01085 [Candidatus Latescibacteria bacterium]|jgi:hypothetical protein|nr:hypothetical protein [Candidatus Latescibacterota bacterium]
MISFLLRTTGQALIGGGVRYAIGNDKIRARAASALSKIRPRKRKPKITIADLQEKLRDMEGWITHANQRLDEMEHYNENHFVAMRQPIPADIFNPETGEVLENQTGDIQQDHWSEQEKRWT